LNNPEKKIKQPSYLLYFEKLPMNFSFFSQRCNKLLPIPRQQMPSLPQVAPMVPARHQEVEGVIVILVCLVKLAASMSGLTQTQLAGEVAEDRCIREGRIADLRHEHCGVKCQCAAFSEEDADAKAVALDEEIADIDNKIANEMALLETPRCHN
jgi:hypothetical protein